jgi:hypothetical protein
MRHAFVRVADLAVLPCKEHAFGVFDHHRGVTLDLLALKCGLSQSSLASPEITLAGTSPHRLTPTVSPPAARTVPASGSR